MSLRDLNFRDEYRSGESDPLRDLYRRALSESCSYWRAVGFFSSTAFEAIGSPLGDFVHRGGRMRLVTSVKLSDEDVEAIERGLSRKEVCETRLLDQIRQEFHAPMGRGAQILAAMLEDGCLEIKIALPVAGRGIYHEKVGVFIDQAGAYVSFSGSQNESLTAFESNYECVDVYTSWDDTRRASQKKAHFEALWTSKASNVEIYDFPDAAKKSLIQRYKVEGSQASSPAKPSPEYRPLWAHQRLRLEAFLNARRGILEMATGTGKTRTAIEIAFRLVTQGKVKTIIVTTDGNDLLNQWYYELTEFAVHLPQRFRVQRHYEQHKEGERFLLGPEQSILLVSRQQLPRFLKRTKRLGHETLLIHDEVHRLGSPANRRDLDDLSADIEYRLGLSATPEREYDSDGTAFIEQHIGPKLLPYRLEDALRDGILAPFDYHPLSYIPTEDDRSRVQNVYKMQTARRVAGNPMTREELWIELARVYKTSKAKLPLFDQLISRRPDILRRCIIFVETMAYGLEVLDLVHRYRADFHTYFSGEESETLQRFAQGELECLLTCHRLSEGIDIRSLTSVVLFSSNRSPLETIQRMGRCLRIDPAQPGKVAQVVDFVRARDNEDDDSEDDDLTSDEKRQQWLQQLSTIRPAKGNGGTS